VLRRALYAAATEMGVRCADARLSELGTEQRYTLLGRRPDVHVRHSVRERHVGRLQERTLGLESGRLRSTGRLILGGVRPQRVTVGLLHAQAAWWFGVPERGAHEQSRRAEPGARPAEAARSRSGCGARSRLARLSASPCT